MSSPSAKGIGVAVVNDDATQLNLLAGLLAREGYLVRAWSDAGTALGQLEAKAPPHLVVTDLYMPGIDGWRFCRLLRSPEYAAFNRIPILVVSATFSGEDAARIAMDLGANAFQPAPIDGKQFLEKVRALLRGESIPERPRVLIVDDLVDLCDLLRNAFLSYGYEVDVAHTLGEATAAVRGASYQVAILDFHLPDGPGDRLLSVLGRDQPDCVCVMATVDSNPDLALAWMRRGAAALVRKPFSPEYLIDLCGKARRERALLRAEDLLELRTRELRASEAKYRELVQNARSIIMRHDTEGRITFFNEFAQRFFGYREEEVLGRRVTSTIAAGGDGELAHSAEDFVAWLTGGDPSVTCEAQNLRRNGEKVWVVWTRQPVLDGRGDIREFLCVGSDVSARKQGEAERERLQAQLLQAQKMEAVGQLAGGVAHDFNNVLAAMLMHMGLMLQNPRLAPEFQPAIIELQRDAKRAASLTRQLLMYSRRSVMRMRIVDLREILDNMTAMLRRLLGEHIELVVEGGSQVNCVKADPGMIEQVVMNLCVNARDAMPKSGRLQIATVRVDVDESRARGNPEARPGSFVCLTVEDTGCGMDANTLKSIFEPFFTTKDVGKGTGLGLATVQGIVKQHLGWVEVASTVGQGSRFSVFLPLETERPPDPVSADKPLPAVRGSETILLVEDESIVRTVTTQFLRSQGYVVHPAANGREALRLWERLSDGIDLLLTDMVMPEGMTGLELAATLRESRPGLKVIVSSGYSTDLVDRGRPESLGIVYVPKPCEPSVLLRELRLELERQR